MSSWIDMGTVELIQRHAPKGKTYIRVGLSKFGEKSFVDIREYFLNDEGTLQPTKKGVSVTPHMMQTLVDALRNAADHVGVIISDE